MCAVSQPLCVERLYPSQVMCARNGPLLRVEPFIIVRRYTYPDLTSERALKTDDRAEYEASFVLEGLRRAAGENSLSAIIRDRLTPARSIEHEQSVAHEQSPGGRVGHAVRSTTAASLRVVDMATGAVDLLSNFVDALLGSKPTLPPEGVQRVTAQRRALAAMESMRESMERGENLHASDVAALTPSQLENIKAKGDDHVREMIADAAPAGAKNILGKNTNAS
jgi:hypothetical protein